MTTKEAIDLAIEILQREPTDTDRNEAAKRLQQLQRREIVMQWSKEAIISALDDWQAKNGRPPTVTNLVEPGMPGASIIQKHFGMRASAFLHKRYPSNDKSFVRQNQYGFATTDDWLSCFREQFKKHCGTNGFSSKTYNTLKDKGTPLWMTIARHCGTTQWSQLMELAGVKYPNKEECLTPGSLHVSLVKSPWLERYEAAVAKREELDRELIAVIEQNSKRKK